MADEPIRVCLMIEGQEDVGWDHWRALAEACERGGFDTLFRSDHYISVDDRRERGALEAWGTICGLAATTSRIGLGTLVSPVTFRHPSVLAKLAVTADHISGGGRIEVGLGGRMVGGRTSPLRLSLPPDGHADGDARGAAGDRSQ